MLHAVSVVLAVVVLGWPTPSVDMAPRYIGDYQLQVTAGRRAPIDLPIPEDYSCAACRVEFSWQIVSPVPAPRDVVLETTSRPAPGVTSRAMDAVGDVKGSSRMSYAVVNKSGQTVVIEFHFVAYDLPAPR